jgi:hypothetical protein
MDKDTRNAIERATQRARKLLEEDFAAQLEGDFDVHRNGEVAGKAGKHLSPRQGFARERIVAAIVHKRAAGMSPAEAARDYLRDAAFTTLNRFVALKMLEARELVQECITKGEQSPGYREFCGMAPGLPLLSDSAGYRLYIECLFDELSVGLKVLFNRRDVASVLWPKRACFEELLKTLNVPDLAAVWREDETIGWVYQYYNDEAERKQMREESSAPRNSRELAVRNQFFTPRYVVEFLTDNTLGRLWYEMTCGETGLRDRCRYLVRRPTEVFLKPGVSAPGSAASGEAANLSQEELLRQPVHIPHRPLKDPREVRLLDPACGSMHFGLYAFDLFTVIYDEAWEIAQGRDDTAKSAESFAPFVAFVATFADKPAFLREVPRLIVERNIHGIDIDPRAAQIAGLSLWLRAQRAWHQAGVKPADRPRITRSNLVCAEPMPGEKELLREFVEQQFPAGERPAFAFLLEKIFDCMTLAGEAGSLLRIEEEIRTAIADAKRLWKEGAKAEQAMMFAEPGEKAGRGKMRLDLSGITDEQFWERAEQRIYDALEAYAEQAENGGGFQRRLFADDAAQGFAFIDLCRTRYDVVVMNPPYGAATATTDSWIREVYPDNCNDLYAAFSQRAFEMTGPTRGSVGAITSKTFLYSKRLREFRKTLAEPRHRLDLLIDFGLGVLDAMVETAAWVARANPPNQASFWDWTREDKVALTINDKALALLLGEQRQLPTLATLEQFRVLPFGLFSYWCPPEVLVAVSHLNAFEPGFGESVKGLTTFDDFRFIRLMWEVAYDAKSVGDWRYIAKGGGWSRYHSESAVLMDWRFNGEIPRQNELKNYSTDARSKQSVSFWFRSGLTFSEVSSLGFSVQPQQKGNLFGGSGFCIFPKASDELAFWLAFFNSRPVFSLMAMFSTDRHWNSEMVARLPVPEIGSQKKQLIELGQQQFALARKDAEVSETAAEFVRCSINGETFSDEAFNENQAEIDQIVSAAYGFMPASIEVLEQKYSLPTHRSETAHEPSRVDALSYALGVAFGRWDIRFATGERPAPELPDPFAPLPVCPPGMLQSDDGLPLSPEAGRRLSALGRYPLDVAWDGILVDEPEHPLDIERRVHAALAVLWAERADALENEACALLGVPTLREWFRRPTGFFAAHVKRYSRSRRQAPIYWPLSTTGGSYSVWLYYHRFGKDTLYRTLEHVKEKVVHEEAKLSRVTSESGSASTAGQRKELAAQDEFVIELRAFHDEVARVAPLWNPNFNDGAIINYGPLWRLIGHRPWQKAVKGCWDELVRGEYDWAHLAMHLWPERVVPKCVKDRSLAIAHGLDDVFWVEGTDGKWAPRETPTKSVDELVKERTSPAVKSALKSLLEAPAAAGRSGGRRGGGRRKSAAAADGGDA